MSTDIPAANPRRWVRVSVAGVCAVVALSALWLVVTGLLAYREATAVNDTVRAAESALATQSFADVAEALPAARESAHRAAQLTSGAPWWVAGHLPFVGSWVTSAQSLLWSFDSVLAATAPLDSGLTAVANGRLRSADGSVNLGLLTDAVPSLNDTANAARDAEVTLNSIDATSVPAPLAATLQLWTARLPEIVASLDSAAEFATHIPPLLGANGKRTWLVLLQNPAEARATGGLIGGYALVTADRGHLALTSSGSNDDLLKNGPITTSVVSQGLRDLWRKDLADWRSINLSPHFPDTGILAHEGMNERGTPVDGVVAVDPTIVSALLAGTGPLTVGGTELTSTTVADYITRQVYVDHPNDAAKDAALLSILRQTMVALTTGSLDAPALGTALLASVPDGHLKAWSPNATEQAWLEPSAVGGSVSVDRGPHIALGLNNGAGNKIDAFITSAAEYLAGGCPSFARQNSQLTIAMTNAAPEGLPEYVSARFDSPDAPAAGERILLAVYAPVGALLYDATLDGTPVPIGGGIDRDRPVWTVEIDLDRLATRVLVLDFSEDTVQGSTPTISAPPMANRMDARAGYELTCGVEPE
ncbi:MAG: DUF4012 domain-containing protein [Actinobacteria bacterium]|uniref:Unannotated protein n=1 Tax=freshwater metagenome TaxID=449393 RepID=A0A6J7LCL3_9ZZZZ|nr:DUF4012 domain-containing protein [Actinomycetota bacterium]